MKKLAFHIHSNYSFDCNINPKKIVDFAIKRGIDYLVICDHDSIIGSVEALKYSRERGYNIEIPISAEYLTDIGDLVVVNLSKYFNKIFDHKILCKTVKDFGGYTILSHPFKGHKLDKVDYTNIDYIETFNSRCSKKENERAFLLAKTKNKKHIYASDAHFLSGINNVIALYKGNNPFKNEEIIPLNLDYTSINKIYYSQLIKAKKTRKVALLKNILFNIVKYYIKKVICIIIRFLK
ncbi:MAG: PHP domain-containing protein [Candidatus Atribacteria bacterium]